MKSNRVCRPLSRMAAVIVVLAIVGLSPSCNIDLYLVLAQTGSGLQTKGDEQLVVVSTELKASTIQFGDKLELFVTLQNQGKAPVSIPAGELILKNQGWIGFPGGRGSRKGGTLSALGAAEPREVAKPLETTFLLSSIRGTRLIAL